MSVKKSNLPRYGYVQDSNKIWLHKVATNNIVDHIPAKIYRPTFDPETGRIGLAEDMDSFKQRSNVRYGDIVKYRDRIIKEAREKGPEGPMGVIAIGRVGSGKSLLGEDIANKRLQEGIPAIVVNGSVPIPILHEILRGIVSSGQPVTVFFDEFGKYYSSREDDDASDARHASLLQLFGDQALTNVLFYLTTNQQDTFRNLGIFNRPSRILFKMPVDYIEITSYIDMIEKAKLPKDIADFIFLNMLETDLKTISGEFNSDVMRTILEKVYVKGMSIKELQAEAMFYNVPMLEYHYFLIKSTTTAENLKEGQSLRYEIESFNGKKLKIRENQSDELLETDIDVKAIVKETSFKKAANQTEKSANIFIEGKDGFMHEFSIIIKVGYQKSHMTMRSNFSPISAH